MSSSRLTRFSTILAAIRRDSTNREALLMLVGQVARLAVGLGSSILIARNLGAASLGLFGVLGTVGLLASTLLDLGTTRSGVARVAAVERHDPSRIRSTALALLGVKFAAALLVLVPAFLLSVPLSQLILGMPQAAPLLQLVLLGVLIRAGAGGLAAVLQGLRQFTPLVLSQLANAVAAFILFALLAFLARLDVSAALAVGIAGSVVSTLVLLFWFPRHVRGNAPLRLTVQVRALLNTGRWIWLSDIFSILALQFDLVILNRMLAPAPVGYYSLALNLALNAEIVQQSLYVVLLPVASGLTRAEFRQYGRNNLWRVGAFALGLVLLMPLARPGVELLYGSAFSLAGDVFAWMLAIVIFDLVTMPLTLLAFPMQRAHVFAFADGLRVVVLVAGLWLLVPLGGLGGAVLAKFLSRAAGTVLILIVLARGLH